jgi:electron transport complex protein RnfB
MRKRLAVALIDESRCIGCTRCIEACPVDAIVGAQGWMHTVVAPWCTGCELCLPPCPVDCIALVPPESPWTERDARETKERHTRLKARRARARARAQVPLPARDKRRAAVALALQRARNKSS